MNILGKEKQASKADVERLCRAVEGAMNQSMTSPTDFDRLAEAVFDRLHVMISSTTLKRMWGYLPHDSLPTRRTLNTLSLFVGFTDFDQFLLHSAEKGIASSPVLSRSLIKAAMFPPQVFWAIISKPVSGPSFLNIRSFTLRRQE